MIHLNYRHPSYHSDLLLLEDTSLIVGEVHGRSGMTVHELDARILYGCCILPFVLLTFSVHLPLLLQAVSGTLPSWS